jgi:Cu-Zn family superoxide dismutase
VTLEQAPPGEHAVHIHETGDCSADDGSSAGGHWNPTSQDHGRWDAAPFHLGDIGNVVVNEEGDGSLSLITDRWTMGGGGPNDIMGLAVIVHADPDDFTSQPSGAAGVRIGCGVILPH